MSTSQALTNAEGINTITDADYTANDKDYLLMFDTGDIDRTLNLPFPKPENQGLRLFIKKIDDGTGNVIIDPGDSTIDGSNDMRLVVQYAGVEIVNNGTEWLCLSDGRAPKTGGFTGNLDCATAAVATYRNGHLVSVAS